MSPARRTMPHWIRECPKPWVVVDWGVLRSLPSDAGIPGRFTAVLHDRVIAEVLGSDKPEEFRRKLDRILVHPDSQGRVVIGRYWNDIVDEETSPSSVCPGAVATVEMDMSNALLSQQRTGRTFLAANDLSLPVGWIDKRTAFVGLMNRYVDYMRQHRPDHLRLLQDKSRLPRIVGLPTSELAESILETDSRYRSPAWHRLLSQFPDVCAIGRFLRVINWYAMRRASAAEEREDTFGQNYDDCHYVFLSLYTRHIWTLDRGMSDAASAVSGGRVHVHRDWRTIPAYSA